MLKKTYIVTFYLIINLFCSCHICFSQIIEYNPEDNIYDLKINRGYLHSVKGNVKNLITKLYVYDYNSNEYKESSIRYPEGYRPSKYSLDKEGNIIERVFLGTYAYYYRNSKKHKIDSKKTNVLNRVWNKVIKTEKIEEEDFRWDYYFGKEIKMSLFDKYGIIYERNKNNIDVYFLEYKNKHLFDKKGNIDKDNHLVSKELQYRIEYNIHGKIKKFENLNDNKMIHYYTYDKNNNLIREDIYHYSNNEFYEFEMKTFLLNAKNDVTKKNVYKAYIKENPFDESTMLKMFINLISDKKIPSKLKYDNNEFEYEYEYDKYDNWTTKFYQYRASKIVRKLEYH
ncbi:hypothetical protein ATE84_4902 [Aquimarina sp. MAR_2010_214]|uniref:hypothetical protein n=1 Tax=Aquimarina sp. MAR_2010_214 TaxID=1250026 RepID=UPI000C70FFF2|nr:hypothetical protein [Aquimarina sp. MAR_2010_214]PKV52775.1 hypothetical protein ATE84_4902 [Aquimarina sp. MAR_2010_214]